MNKTIALMLVVCVAAAVVMAAGKETRKAAGPADVEALITKGLKAYKEGKNQDAIQALQQAIAAIQKSQQQGLSAFFPAAPAGWEADKIESSSVGAISGGEGQAWNMVSLSRKYTQKGKDEDGLRVTISIHSQKELIESTKGMAEAYKNPQMLAAMEASGKVKFTSIDQAGWTGWQIVNTEGNGDATANAFCGDLMLSVQVNKGDARVLKTFWSAIDLKGLAGAATMKVEKPAK